jgi:uncharacterized damage-inducible protein DinB
MQRPDANEFAPYYAGYIERVGARDVLEVLREQRRAMLSLLESVDDEQASFRYAAGKWSLREVIGHVIDSERIFAYRALSLARGEKHPLPGFDEEAYVHAAGFDARSVEDLATEYAAVRNATLTLFEGLPAAAWERCGVANEATFSVRALAYVVAGHEAHHVAVLRERYLS